MVKTRSKLVERRRFIRLRTPIDMSYVLPENGIINQTATKDISADGLRFETHDKVMKESSVLELKLNIPGAPNPIHAKGRVAWKKKVSLEDAAPYDIGIELTEIEEDNKNTFLKFLCDLIYDLPKEMKNVHKKA